MKTDPSIPNVTYSYHISGLINEKENRVELRVAHFSLTLWLIHVVGTVSDFYDVRMEQFSKDDRLGNERKERMICSNSRTNEMRF